MSKNSTYTIEGTDRT